MQDVVAEALWETEGLPRSRGWTIYVIEWFPSFGMVTNAGECGLAIHNRECFGWVLWVTKYRRLSPITIFGFSSLSWRHRNGTPVDSRQYMRSISHRLSVLWGMLFVEPNLCNGRQSPPPGRSFWWKCFSFSSFLAVLRFALLHIAQYTTFVFRNTIFRPFTHRISHPHPVPAAAPAIPRLRAPTQLQGAATAFHPYTYAELTFLDRHALNYS